MANVDYTQMSVSELERQRLCEELVASDAPKDAFERVALILLHKTDHKNPIAVQLVQVEEELYRKGTPQNDER